MARQFILFLPVLLSWGLTYFCRTLRALSLLAAGILLAACLFLATFAFCAFAAALTLSLCALSLLAALRCRCLSSLSSFLLVITTCCSSKHSRYDCH